jgi:CDP-glucose 4,6-dehydratase
VRRLLAAGADVVCLIRDWVPQSELVRAGLIEKVKVVRGDIRDRDSARACPWRIRGQHGSSTSLRQTIVTIANRNPVSTFETNIAGTWNILEAARRSPSVRQLVMASSDKAYGDQEILPYDENTPLQGQHPYDVSKSAADLIASTYAKSYQLPVVITRCGNFYWWWRS